MRAKPKLRTGLAALVAGCALAGAWPSAAQTVLSPIAVGANPQAIAVNPVTNRYYVANADSDSVSVIDGNTGTVITTVAVGDYPRWIAVNSETNTIYVSHILGADTFVIDGATNAVTPLLSGGGGWIAVTPHNMRAYSQRYGSADEISTIIHRSYELTSATKSYGSGGLAVNPTNNWGYGIFDIDGDIVALDLTTPVPYPPLKCPNGSGGFDPQPPDEGDPYGNCIDVAGVPVGVAINPLTNRVYSVSDSGEISVIDGTNSAITATLTPGLTGARAIAVNPVTNKVYAAYADGVAIVDGASNGVSTIAFGSGGGGPVAVGINPLTNTIYVPSADGQLLIIDGATGSSTSVAIPVDANAVAVNPVTNTVAIVHAGGTVTPVVGVNGTPTATGINASINALPGGTSGSSGSITINAASSMSGANLDAVRRVYFRIDGGDWQQAGGSGPYTANFSGLADGSHTIDVFATNGLEAANINTDLANVPITSNVASYTFTVDTSVPAPKKFTDYNGDGLSDLSWTRTTDNLTGLWLMNGSSTPSWGALYGPGSSTLHQTGDYNGDGMSDLLWQAGGNYWLSIMNGLSVQSTTQIFTAVGGWRVIDKGDFDGDGKTDLLWVDGTGTIHGIWLMDGATATQKAALTSPGAGYSIVRVGDFNGDGRTDVLWRNSTTAVFHLLNGATVMASASFTVPGTWTAEKVGDFNADGKADVLWRRSDQLHGVWLMDGTTQLTAVAFFGPANGTVKQVADFNGDGMSDLLWQGPGGRFDISLMNGATIASTTNIFVGDNNWMVIGKGDYNGDGMDDLLWRASANNSYGTWLMNGTAATAKTLIIAPGTAWASAATD